MPPNVTESPSADATFGQRDRATAAGYGRAMQLDTGLARRGLAIALAVSLLAGGCSLASGTLGGRSKCWSEDDPRVASLWRGTLQIDNIGGRLDTPEGDVIPLTQGVLWTRIGNDGVGELVQGSSVVARAGDEVTLFGGAGSDGTLVACAVEEVH